MSESKSVYTESIYARLLVFYETHVPEKFNTIDLQRIYDTYKDKKTTKLEKDLVKKYPVLPTSVLFSEVSRILIDYEISVDFKSKLPEIPSDLKYEKELDPRRTEFNAYKVLQQRQLCISVPKQPRVDNVNKFTSVMDGKHSKNTPLEELMQAYRTKGPSKDALMPIEKQEHAFDRLAREACKRKREEAKTLSSTSSSSGFSDDLTKKVSPHPMQVLLNAYNDKKFIRVVIRKVNGIRGHMDGFIVAFDKHFNIILRDAIERYECCAETTEEGKLSGNHTVTRKFPLIIIRGDNVVLVTDTPIDKTKNDS